MRNNIIKFEAKLALEDTIRVQKQEEKETLKRCTFYFTKQLIDSIDKKSEHLNMGKSEFLRELLEKALDNLEIEE
ncbi:MAG TPA: hypothetical protein GX723_09795 [Thermoanaerobacterales bacterium]|nr:hypothetical protein [Thermoanaerobacterales bacterium]